MGRAVYMHGRRSWIFFWHFCVIEGRAGKHLHNNGHGSKHGIAAFHILSEGVLGYTLLTFWRFWNTGKRLQDDGHGSKVYRKCLLL
jgi:hypothetical protein